MGGEWKTASVSQVASIYIGGTPSRSVPEYWGGNIKWISAKDVTGCSSRYIWETQESISELGLEKSAAKVLGKDTILITARGTVGAICMLAEPMAFNQTCYGLVAKQNTDPAYLYYALKVSLRAITAISYGTVFNTITTTSFDTLEIPLPPLPEQRAIAHILGTLDDKIELNRRMNQTLEAMAQALFKNWFVDFEPFRDQGMQDSPLGKIPGGWKCVAVTEAIEVNPPRRLERGANAVYVDMSALPTASARILDIATRPYTGSGSRFANGDVLFARITPCLENGKTALVDFLSEGEIGWGSTEFIILGPKPPVGTGFIYCLTRHDDFRIHAIQAMTGTSGRQRVDTACFNYYWVAIPEADILSRFEHQVKPWFQKMKANDDESRTLASIRDALLPKLLSGEIRVKDAEKFVEDKSAQWEVT